MHGIKLVMALAVVSLAGCAAEVISSTPRSVVIRAGTAMIGPAQELAQKECMKQGRNAQLNSRPVPGTPGWVFDCV